MGRSWLRPLLASALASAAALGAVALSTSPAAGRVLTSSGHWQSLGPAPVQGDHYAGSESGRVTSLAIATDGTIYAGSASGGVWVSRSGGLSWRPLTDHAPDLAIGALALDPHHPGTIYAATGEDDDCGDCFYSDGILRSTDSGSTWKLLGRHTFYGHYLSSIVVDPLRPGRIYAAGDLGVVISSDGGLHWRRALREPTSDLVVEPGPKEALLAGVEGVGVERSTDGGRTWHRLSGGLPGHRALIGRIALAVAPSDPQVVYAAYAGLRQSCQDCLMGLYVTHDAGGHWKKLKVPDYFREPGKPVAAQGDYDNVLAVSPTDPDVVYAGGIDLLRSTDGGATWHDLMSGSELHTDQHALAFYGGTLYIGNDGGVYADLPSGDIADLNANLSITQVYQGVAVSSDGSRILAGFQDNGTALYDRRTKTWESLIDGDGAFNLIVPGHDGEMLGEVNGELQRSRDGGSDWSTPKALGDVAGPIALDPIAPGDVLLGEKNIWLSTNGGRAWRRITRVKHAGPLSALAVAPSDPQVIYAGWQNGLLEMSQNGGHTWRDIGPAGWATGCPPGQSADPDLYITGLSVSPSDPYRVFASIAYSYPQSLPDCSFVFETPAANASWTSWVDISGSLPAFAVNDVLVSAHGLYAALGEGVYYSPNANAHWRPLGSGLPNVEVTGLTPTPEGGIVAATYGRGVWLLTRKR